MLSNNGKALFAAAAGKPSASPAGQSSEIDVDKTLKAAKMKAVVAMLGRQKRAAGKFTSGSASKKESSSDLSVQLEEGLSHDPDLEIEGILRTTETCIPGRNKMLLLAIVFVVASSLLLLEFIFIYHGGPNILLNLLGAAEAAGWFIGFGLLLDWTVNDLPAPHGRANLLGVCLKLIAAVLFNIQPWSNLLDPKFGVPGYGVVWSNFAGICFFHLGNCINAYDMITMMDWKRPFAKANWPILGMQLFMIATWFLLIADGMAYFNFRCNLNEQVFKRPGLGVSTGSSICDSINIGFVFPGQAVGGALLLAGSLLYTAWAL